MVAASKALFFGRDQEKVRFAAFRRFGLGQTCFPSRAWRNASFLLGLRHRIADGTGP